ncbi:MAG: hypothetical protein K0Q79_488 [Flavipsychrobacter sp.]|nr:hypothetical protein [Flavipsychrobacter sp.]
MKKLILYILLNCLVLFSYAQHPYYYTLHDDNGLPSNEVYQIHQDEFGYMWVGCNTGLYRYDGFNFMPFKNASQNSIAISGLTIAPDKKLYCQNFSGQLFYVANDSLVLLADVKERIRSHPAYTVDGHNNIWIGLPEGILKRDANGKEGLLFKGELYITEFELCPDGSLYAIDVARGLLKIAKNNSGYTWKKIHGTPEAFTNARSTIRRYGNKFYALSSTNGERDYFITEIRSDTAALIKKIPAGYSIEFIYSMDLFNNKIWLGTSAGAICMNLNGDIEQRCFPSEKISDIILDREGNYWFSSLQNGIFIIPDLSLESITSTNSTLKDNNITALKAISNENLLIGTYSGDVYHYSLSSNGLELLPKSKDAAYRNVTSIIPYDEDNIIVGRGSVSVINVRYKQDHSYSSAYIRDMARTGDSIIFVSSEMVGAMPRIQELINRHKYPPRNIKSTAGKHVCVDTTTGTIWISLNDGLAAYEGGMITPFKINEKPIYCNALYADRAGIWAGTVSDGVYNIRNKKVALHLNNTNGLQGSNVRCIISANDTLYIATDVCVNIYYPDGTFAYLDYTEGINAKEITALALTGKYLFIGTIRGLFRLPANSLFTNNTPPNIRITSIVINGKDQGAARSVRLPWNNADVLINFSSVALRSRGKFNYLYRIKGFRDEWQKLDGSANYVRLNHLPPGTFTFEVKAANEDGVASDSVASITIIAEAPFWQQWWFYVLLTILGAAVVTLLFIIRIRKIRSEADTRNQLITSQLTALKAQMNPHFMYNTLNSIQDLILQNDIKSTNYYLSRYSTLMRKILDSSGHNEIELAEEIEILQLYMELEKLRFGNDFTYAISVPDTIGKSILLPSMIIQPFVENAIKHGLLHKKGPKMLEITFDKQGTNLICTIKDNGVGRKKAAEIKERSPIPHKSFATKATERRLELVNMGRLHKIKLAITDNKENGIPTGTEVRLEIPME